MARSAIDIASELARLDGLTMLELRQEWRRLYQTPPPARLSRDILLRGIAYKLQESVLGGLSKSMLRKLQGSSSDGPASVEKRRQRVSFKPGTRLVREWRGVTHTVAILPDALSGAAGVYKSLSVVAREITGAHWSGPRFFGLKAGATADR